MSFYSSLVVYLLLVLYLSVYSVRLQTSEEQLVLVTFMTSTVSQKDSRTSKSLNIDRRSSYSVARFWISFSRNVESKIFFSPVLISEFNILL